MSSPSALLTELKRDTRFKATCPACMENFRLSDAVLFAVGEAPPQAAVLALNAVRQRIQERRRQLARNRELMTNN
jgi:hypothetical protein